MDDGLTLVISPLIALMKDQVDALRLIGYPAGALYSNQDLHEAQQTMRGLADGSLRLLYLSPERAALGEMRQRLSEAHEGRGVKRIAIDEAHCISQWGHDFRPEYRVLNQLRNQFPEAAIHAFTATATPVVQKDILQQLHLRDPLQFIGTFDRPNLTYRIAPKLDAVGQILAAVRDYPEDACIVYCISRNRTEQVATALVAKGVRAAAYHAGLGPDVRRKVSEDFAQERLNVVVATVAFGMGIDRGNVRCVIHDSLPKSLEAYQQETGRAGRAGLPSECLLLYSPSDVAQWKRLIQDSSSPDQLPMVMKHLDDVRAYITGSSCRHRALSEYFGQQYPKASCEACDLCLDGAQVVADSTSRSHKMLALVRELGRNHTEFGFGAGHIADILRGANTQKIHAMGHDALRAYGIFKGLPAAAISDWLGQLVDMGFLGRYSEKYPTLFLTPDGEAALNGRTEIQLRDLGLTTVKAGQKQSGKSEGGPIFAALREWRRNLAGERGVAAFMIMEDRVLYAIEVAHPNSMAELRKISGIGEKRIADFGEAILEIVAAHPLPAVSKSRSGVRAVALSPFFEEGKSAAQTAAENGLAVSTVHGYLADWVAENPAVGLRPWVSANDEKRVREVLTTEIGSGPLKPIFEALGGDVPYDQIRLVRTKVDAGH